MIHPKVLEGCGIDSTVYSGWAFGMGLERLALGQRAKGAQDARGLLYLLDTLDLLDTHIEQAHRGVVAVFEDFEVHGSQPRPLREVRGAHIGIGSHV